MSALEDAIAILGCFSFEDSALTQAELTRRVGRPKATVSRVMKTLRETGMLEFDAGSRLYRPGIRLFELGQISRDAMAKRSAMRKELKAAISDRDRLAARATTARITRRRRAAQ